MIQFDIPKATPSNNKIKGMNRFEYKKLREEFFWLVKSHAPSVDKPIQKCDLIIKRYGSRLLDWSNAYGGIKPLEDCLVIQSKSSPNGLGLIVDDNPNCVLSLTMHQQKCKRNEERTIIKIIER